ncbi:hypothetical protein [Achromobacter deleyi]|uniref:hypothetical protein n=1 Tax=Achromobacter deleyi TaxID=1353891 RepID=UPI0014920493|nr:hypothetical protein [Achromobacter deleyi]QVQ26397.1 hypothetical protein HLG70_26740 [Achromobacter deleyi]UIP21961.1 hypothetical protein LYZ39_05410 [Achromobacter deleyi]
MEDWVGKTVGEVLALCQTRYADVTMVDEPPGKLRAVELDCAARIPVSRYVLEFDYRPALFSAQRDWPESLVGAQTVTAVRNAAEPQAYP